MSSEISLVEKYKPVYHLGELMFFQNYPCIKKHCCVEKEGYNLKTPLKEKYQLIVLPEWMYDKFNLLPEKGPFALHLSHLSHALQKCILTTRIIPSSDTDPFNNSSKKKRKRVAIKKIDDHYLDDLRTLIRAQQNVLLNTPEDNATTEEVFEDYSETLPLLLPEETIPVSTPDYFSKTLDFLHANNAYTTYMDENNWDLQSSLQLFLNDSSTNNNQTTTQATVASPTETPKETATSSATCSMPAPKSSSMDFSNDFMEEITAETSTAETSTAATTSATETASTSNFLAEVTNGQDRPTTSTTTRNTTTPKSSSEYGTVFFN
jgi:hypothetical protein